MRKYMTKLGPTLLGIFVVSGLACGGSSNKGTGCDGPCAFDGGPTPTADAPVVPQADTALPAIDQAPAIDEAEELDGGSPDSAVQLDGEDTDANANADVAADAPADLPWGPEIQAKRDLPVKRDLMAKNDVLPIEDLLPAPDTRAPDGATVPDASPDEVDTAPVADTAPDMEPDLGPDLGPDLEPDTLKEDADPTLPAVSADKEVYEHSTTTVTNYITATWVNGSAVDHAWIGVFEVGSGDTAYVLDDWFYTHTVTAGTMENVLFVPTTTGTYELRMFEDGGYTRIATSPRFVVE